MPYIADIVFLQNEIWTGTKFADLHFDLPTLRLTSIRPPFIAVSSRKFNYLLSQSFDYTASWPPVWSFLKFLCTEYSIQNFLCDHIHV